MSHRNSPTRVISEQRASTLKITAGFKSVFILALAVSSASALAQSTPSAGVSAVNIQPLLSDSTATEGHFSDPYPIHLAPWLEPLLPQSFSGTTKDILTCAGKIEVDCFQETAFTVTAGPDLLAEAASVGTDITGTFENSNIYQDSNGEWSMATTMYVRNLKKFPDVTHWNLIVHAHPTDPFLPTAWVADSVLVGKFSEPNKADYDGKYFEDAGRLYLIYSKRLTDPNENVAQHDGITAQLLQSPKVPAAVDAVTLLAPSDVDGGFNSEYFFVDHANNSFKLIETGNITKIGNKYVMAYSTGDYEEPDYKSGLAFSDTFLPTASSSYKRVLKLDTIGIWNQPGHEEVLYLLQAEKPLWPNYVASQVKAPGVPSVVHDRSGRYFLYFAGFLPSEATIDPNTGFFKPALRRPFFITLNVNIPANTTVEGTPNAALAGWITTEQQ